MIQKKITKKKQIISAYRDGVHNIAELAALTQTRPSYVAGILRTAMHKSGYFDLFTTTDEPMNIYSPFFAKRLGFRTENISRRSIKYIDHVYNRFENLHDIAGQHHALVMALTMFNRARALNKNIEAKIFCDWLIEKLENFSKLPNTIIKKEESPTDVL